MKSRKFIILLLLSVTIVSMLACTIFIGGPKYPDRTIPVSSESVSELQTAIAQAWEGGAISNQISFSITEQQITSYLAEKIQQQPKPFITNPQVFLQDNEIQLYGTAKQGNFQATAAVIMTASVDELGELNLEMKSADFGPLPVPSGLLEALTAMVEEAYTGAVGPMATGIRLVNVVVADGIMTITGQLK